MSEEEIRRSWESRYRTTPLEDLPWKEGKPSAELVELVESGMVEKGLALDICTGSGTNAVYLARQGFTCYGIDISSTAIGYAREKAVQEGLTCNLVSGNAIRLPYPDFMFTLIFDRGCFHNVPPDQRKMFIQGAHRVLKPSGKYLLICFSKKDHTQGMPYSFSPQDIRRLFQPIFKIHRIKEVVSNGGEQRRIFLSVLMEKVA